MSESVVPRPTVVSRILPTQALFIGKVVLACAVAVSATVLLTEVATTDSARLPGWLEALHRALRLFVLDAPGVPAEGTGVAGGLLWGLYFLAPVLSGAFLVDGLRRIRGLLKTPERVAKGSSGHVIICGYGNHGRLALDQLVGPGKRYKSAVVIDRDLAQAPFISSGANGKVLIPVLRESLAADVRGTLKRAGLSNASALVAATGNDMLNVAICLTAGTPPSIARTGGGCRKLLALVGDYSLAEQLKPRLAGKIGILNTYRKAAARLLAKHEGFFAKRDTSLVIVGFGRFGQALAQEAWGHERIKLLIVVDKVADEKVAIFKHGVDEERAKKVVAVQCDAEHPGKLSGAVARAVEGTAVLAAVCTDNDASNLRLGFKLKDQTQGVTLLTRTFDEQAKTVTELMDADQITCFEMSRLLADVIPDALEGGHKEESV